MSVVKHKHAREILAAGPPHHLDIEPRQQQFLLYEAPHSLGPMRAALLKPIKGDLGARLCT